MADSHIDLELPDASATEALGAALGHACGSLERRSAVIYFQGDLGVGKTTCVRGLLRSLGVTGVIRSPTYTLIEAYPVAGWICVHCDLYRVQGVAEVDELGLRDYFADPCLLLIEWPEKGSGSLPPADLELTLNHLGDMRQGRLSALTPMGQGLASFLLNDNRIAPYVPNLT
jgi:tRNA threonylcarbamoyladenosine biosynthesis protein TsaE